MSDDRSENIRGQTVFNRQSVWIRSSDWHRVCLCEGGVTEYQTGQSRKF